MPGMLLDVSLTYSSELCGCRRLKDVRDVEWPESDEACQRWL